MKKVLIIGGGFAGCASAHQFQFLRNWEVTLVERSPFLGAGVRTMWHGGHPHMVQGIFFQITERYIIF